MSGPERGAREGLPGQTGWGFGGHGCIYMCGWAPWLSAGSYGSTVVLWFIWLCRVEFPDQGSKLGPLHWERRGPPGKSLTALLISSSPIENKKLFVCLFFVFKNMPAPHTVRHNNYLWGQVSGLPSLWEMVVEWLSQSPVRIEELTFVEASGNVKCLVFLSPFWA